MATTSDPAVRSIPACFAARVEQSADREAYRFPDGDTWRTLTWAQTYRRVRAIALGLHALGVEPEERCAIVASTRIEWILSDLGVLCAGGTASTIYPASTADECAYIVTDSAAVVVFAENDEQVAKLRQRRAELTTVRTVVTFDGASDGDWVTGLDELEERGRALDAERPGRFEELVDRVGPDDLATLIYTSGTTGRPKGVRLSQRNWLHSADAVRRLRAELLTDSDVQYLWMPLSHSFGKSLLTLQLLLGFRTAVDGRVDRLIGNLAVIRPTFVVAAPRVLEKVHNRIVADAEGGGPVSRAVFGWAFRVGARVSGLRRAGRRPGWPTRIAHAVADRLVFRRLRAMFGGRLRYFICGGAPFSRDIAEFFHAAGVLVLESYGLTECSTGGFVNRPGDFRFGTVGRPLPGTELRFAADGEILLRGPGMMQGYHNLPDQTTAVLVDGWLHTGDIGELRDGFLVITDRKKDMIKTAGGKYVAPVAVEGRFKAGCPYVSGVVVHGDRRPYCTALVTLDRESIVAWAREHGLGGLSYERLAAHPKVDDLIGSYVAALNRDSARHERIRRFAVLPRELSAEAGEITASMKVRRRTVEAHFQAVLERLYASSDSPTGRGA